MPHGFQGELSDTSLNAHSHTSGVGSARGRVLVAMSGGVDSSVAAALLIEQGYEVIGVTMHLWDYAQNERQSCDPTERFDTCCSHEDVADARSVASQLGIPFYVLDYEKEFRSRVVDYFTAEYVKGRTPNPCVACNTFLKFDHLMARAERLGCQYVATGHYAIIDTDNDGQHLLRKGVDEQKDQSYFLYSMTQERLRRTLFPLGRMTKAEVRSHAERFGLATARKKERMEICFVPGNDYADFVRKNVEFSAIISGDVFHTDGRKLAEHDGIHHFTVGQRKGLKVAAGEVVYVVDIDPNSGRVTVGPKEALLKKSFTIDQFHCVVPVSSGEHFKAKIRYRSQAAAGEIRLCQDSAVQFVFEEPQFAITPGQVVVLYRDDVVVAGGFIGRVVA
jgi:tRNA-specific 2-thiouridylase